METSMITAESTPNYDEWGWDDYWGCAEWTIWHMRLKEKYGLSKAKEIWLTAWEKQGPWDHALNWCRYNTDFVEYFLKNGIDIRSFLSAIFTNVADTAINVTGSVANISRNLNWILPVAGGLAVLGLGVVVVNKLEKLDLIK